MTEPFLGQIQPFGFNFAPQGWAFCNGTTLSIQQNTALFSLLGVNYGGDGRTNFKLPNFAARASCNQGQAPGLTPRAIGSAFGDASVTLTSQEMPAHNHGMAIFAQNDPAKRVGSPMAGAALAVPSTISPYASAAQPDAQFALTSGFTGGGSPHENRQPYLAVNFCISLAGIFPSFG